MYIYIYMNNMYQQQGENISSDLFDIWQLYQRFNSIKLYFYIRHEHLLFLKTGSRKHFTLKSQLIPVYFHFVLLPLQIYKVCFFLIFPTDVLIYTQILVIYFLPFSMEKVVARVPIFVIAPVPITAFIVSTAVPRVIKFCSCVGKCNPKGQKGPLV